MIIADDPRVFAVLDKYEENQNENELKEGIISLVRKTAVEEISAQKADQQKQTEPPKQEKQQIQQDVKQISLLQQQPSNFQEHVAQYQMLQIQPQPETTTTQDQQQNTPPQQHRHHHQKKEDHSSKSKSQSSKSADSISDSELEKQLVNFNEEQKQALMMDPSSPLGAALFNKRKKQNKKFGIQAIKDAMNPTLYQGIYLHTTENGESPSLQQQQQIQSSNSKGEDQEKQQSRAVNGAQNKKVNANENVGDKKEQVDPVVFTHLPNLPTPFISQYSSEYSSDGEQHVPDLQEEANIAIINDPTSPLGNALFHKKREQKSNLRQIKDVLKPLGQKKEH